MKGNLYDSDILDSQHSQKQYLSQSGVNQSQRKATMQLKANKFALPPPENRQFSRPSLIYCQSARAVSGKNMKFNIKHFGSRNELDAENLSNSRCMQPNMSKGGIAGGKLIMEKVNSNPINRQENSLYENYGFSSAKSNCETETHNSRVSRVSLLSFADKNSFINTYNPSADEDRFSPEKNLRAQRFQGKNLNDTENKGRFIASFQNIPVQCDITQNHLISSRGYFQQGSPKTPKINNSHSAPKIFRSFTAIKFDPRPQHSNRSHQQELKQALCSQYCGPKPGSLNNDFRQFTYLPNDPRISTVASRVVQPHGNKFSVMSNGPRLPRKKWSSKTSSGASSVLSFGSNSSSNRVVKFKYINRNQYQSNTNLKRVVLNTDYCGEQNPIKKKIETKKLKFKTKKSHQINFSNKTGAQHKRKSQIVNDHHQQQVSEYFPEFKIKKKKKAEKNQRSSKITPLQQTLQVFDQDTNKKFKQNSHSNDSCRNTFIDGLDGLSDISQTQTLKNLPNSNEKTGKTINCDEKSLKTQQQQAICKKLNFESKIESNSIETKEKDFELGLDTKSKNGFDKSGSNAETQEDEDLAQRIKHELNLRMDYSFSGPGGSLMVISTHRQPNGPSD